GTNVMSFSSPPTLTKGSVYYAAIATDAAANYNNNNASTYTIYLGTTTFASFPVNNPSALAGPTTGASGPPCTISGVVTDNTAGIQELIQDGDTSYVYSSTVQEDKYSMSAIATYYTVLAQQYFACYKRSDVGSRTMQLSVAANGSSDTALFSDAAIPNSYTFKFPTKELHPTSAA